MSSLITFLRQSIEEVTHKITWPTQDKVKTMANYFLLGLLIATTIVGLINISFDNTLDRLYYYYK